ncbi:alkyl sulfatase C-terminal domain-containing protein [Geodermatophilus sp. SYSU D00758]
MATTEECRTALESVLGDLAAKPAAKGLDRSLSCHLPDLGEVFRARLSRGAVRDLRAEPAADSLQKADIRLTMASDDLVALTRGELSFGPAWASGRVKLEAGLRDMLRLRALL